VNLPPQWKWQPQAMKACQTCRLRAVAKLRPKIQVAITASTPTETARAASLGIESSHVFRAASSRAAWGEPKRGLYTGPGPARTPFLDSCWRYRPLAYLSAAFSLRYRFAT